MAGKEDLSGTIQVRCTKNTHRFYAQFRKEIVNSMAVHLGRQETHTPLSITALIGKDRKIPGYRYLIEDKQADLNTHKRTSVLKEFDQHNTPTELISYLYKKCNCMLDGKGYLHDVIPEYLAGYFDIEIDLIRTVIYDENYHFTMETIALILELVGILKVQADKESEAAHFCLEPLFKQELKKSLKMDEAHSPVSLSNWNETPLKNLLILSDGYFYDLSTGSDDLVYLVEKMGENGDGKTPKKTQYTAEDRKKYALKIQHLNISNPPQRANSANLHDNEPERDPAPPYSDLENLINDLAETPPGGDFEGAFVPYLEIYQHPAIQELKIPNLNNFTVSTCNLYEINMHILAIYLWNALSKVGHSLPAPSRELINAASFHKIDLLD